MQNLDDICYYQPMAAKKQVARSKKQAAKPRKENAVAIETTTKRSSKRFDLSALTSYRPSKKVLIIIAVIAILLLLTTQKGVFLAATVNSSPITNLELLARLNQQYRTQMINQLVNEKLILGEAQKKGVSVSGKEVEEKITQIEGNVGGPEALDSLLSQQGQTRASLRDQIRVQLVIEKLYANEATVSADEVDKFIIDNKDSLQATTSAEATKEATEMLKQQKLGKVFNEKFQELKSAAKIQIF